MLGQIVLSDGVVVALIGTSFAACLSLIAYTARTLSNVQSRIDGQDKRLERVEDLIDNNFFRYGRGPRDDGRSAVELIALIALAIVIGLTIFVSLNAAHQENERCRARQNLYDGEVVVVRLIGHELAATDARINLAVDHLKQTIGARPEC